MDAHVLVPLKRLDRAKSRLEGALAAGERAALMVELLCGVVDAVHDAGVRRITLVTSERITHEHAETWFDGDLPWNDALAAAARSVVASEVVAVVSADLPDLRPSEVRTLLRRTPRRGLVVARAHDGGTNAVSMRPCGAMPTVFGAPGSALLHAEGAWARGLDCVVLDLPGLAFDVDTPDDLGRMLAVRRRARDVA